MFADLPGADFTLAPASSARDTGLASLAGRSAPVDDRLGLPRPMNDAFDIGAYEFPAPPPCPADFNGDGFVNPDDLADFITCFFLDIQLPGFCPAADYNSDTSRDPDDLADFITTFFSSAC